MLPMTDPAIREYFSKLGKRNKGKPMSARKRKAVLANLARGRKRLEQLPASKRAKIFQRRSESRKNNQNGEKLE